MQILGSGIDLKEVEYLVGLSVVAIAIICFAITPTFYDGLDLTVNTIAPNAEDVVNAGTAVNQLLGNDAQSLTETILGALMGTVTLIPLAILILIKTIISLTFLYIVIIEVLYKWFALWGVMN